SLDAALSARDTLPMSTWLEFAGENTPVEKVTDAVDTAAAGVRTQADVVAYAGRERAKYDAGAATLEGARALIHPDYDFARAQARAQQADAILEVLRR